MNLKGKSRLFILFLFFLLFLMPSKCVRAMEITDVSILAPEDKKTADELTPQIVVKSGDKILSEGIDYKIKIKKQSKKNIRSGVRGPKIVVSGIGECKGKVEYHYEPLDHNIYVAPDGNDNATGDITHPLKTIQRAIYAAQPGDNILLYEGTYVGANTFVRSGSESEGYITIKPLNQSKAIVKTKKKKNGAAFNLNGNGFIKISNLSICGLLAKNVYGVLMCGGEESVYIENCEFSDIVTTKPGKANKAGGESNAILLLGEDETSSIKDIYITGNKVHDNVNGWSENISVAGNCENVQVINNEVYNNTNIGIDFYGNAEYCSDKSKDQPRNCKCIGNTVHDCNSFYAENAGIYIDGSHDIFVSGNNVYNNSFGIEIGSEEWRDNYDDNNAVRDIYLLGNDIHDNKECGLRIGGWTNDESTGVVKNCVIEGNHFSNNSTEIILSKCDRIKFIDNTFDGGIDIKSAITYDDEIDKSKITNILY